MNVTQARKILGVDASADKDAIKKAYRSLAMKHHPDREGGDEKKFKELQEALDVLEKPAVEQHGRSARSEMPDGFADFFSKFGGQAGFNADMYQQRIFNATIDITAAEAINGCEKIVNINGVAEQVRLTINKGIGPEDVIHTVDAGQVIYRVTARIITDFKISWTKPGRGDVTMDLLVSPAKLIKGGWQDVKTPFENSSVSVRIPAGLESGKLLKVKEKGYFRSINSDNRADLFLRVIPMIKKPEEYTQEEREEFLTLFETT